jgi:hypothetical protein
MRLITNWRSNEARLPLSPRGTSGERAGERAGERGQTQTSVMAKMQPVLSIILLAVVRVMSANDLVAEYRFDGVTPDVLAKSSGWGTKNVKITGGALYLNGIYENGGWRHGCRAVAPVSGLAYEHFTVSVDFFPLDFSPKRDDLPWWFTHLPARMRDAFFDNWRARRATDHASILVGGTSYRWMGFRCRDGLLELTLNNQEYTHRLESARVPTGKWHNLICAFDLERRTVVTLLDGEQLETVVLPVEFKLAIIGSPDASKDKKLTFADYSCGSAFNGYADNLLVFGRALDAAEIKRFYDASAKERRKGWPPTRGPILVAISIGGMLFVVLWFLIRGKQKKRVACVPV